MNIVNIAEAKAHLSELVEMALKGKEVIIGKRNIPLVKLLVVNKPSKTKRKAGRLKGKVIISKDFEALPPEIMEAFEKETL